MIETIGHKRIEDSVYAAPFHPLLLSNTKRAELIRVAKLLRNVRNEISASVHPHFEDYIGVSRFQFESEFLPKYKHSVSSHYIGKAIQDVYKMYKIRSDSFLRQIKFEQI